MKKTKDVFQKVGEAAIRDADKFNKFGKEAERVLKGKPHRREKKIVLTIGEMKTTILYFGLDDKRLYRKVGTELQIMTEPGQWKPVHVNSEFLQSMKLREY